MDPADSPTEYPMTAHLKPLDCVWIFDQWVGGLGELSTGYIKDIRSGSTGYFEQIFNMLSAKSRWNIKCMLKLYRWIISRILKGGKGWIQWTIRLDIQWQPTPICQIGSEYFDQWVEWLGRLSTRYSKATWSKSDGYFNCIFNNSWPLSARVHLNIY